MGGLQQAEARRGMDGINRPLPKAPYLLWNISRIKVLMMNLRWLTVDCEGQIAPIMLIEMFDLLVRFATGHVSFLGLNCGLKVHRMIVSYLLIGSSNSWSKALISN